MNKKWQFPLRRMLALLLCVASLVGMFPTVLRQEASAASASYRDRATAVAGAVTADGKQLAYMGETVYTIGQSTAVGSALATIAAGLTVFEPNNGDKVVSYDQNVDLATGLGQTGYYTLQVPEGLDTSLGGRYEVNILYNGTSGSTVIGTVTMLIAASGDSKILSMSGLRDHDTAKANAETTQTSIFYLQLIQTDASIPRGTLFAIRSASGYMMSYDPRRSSAAENTGSFEYDGNGNSLGTIYNIGDNYYMDHSLRSDALWYMAQFYAHDGTHINGTHNWSMDFATSTSLNSYTPLFKNGKICVSVTIQKGELSSDNYSFWYNNGESSSSTEPVFRHLNVRSVSAPFCNNNTMFNSTNGHAYTKDEACKYILEKVDGNQFIFYFRMSDTDLRVLGCDANGNWYVKQYTGYGSKAETVDAVWSNTEHRLNLYKYIRDDDTKKKVAYKGYTEYNVAKDISLADLKTAIYDNLTVFDTERKNLYVPGENELKGNGQDKAGYYWLEFPSNFSTSTAGSYEVRIMYNSLVKDTGSIVSEEIGTVTVNIQTVTYTIDTNHVGVVSKNAGASREVYSADSSGNPTATNTAYITVTAGGQTTKVPVTVGMLSPDVDTGTPGTYSGLTLTYMGQTLATDYVLHVHSTTLNVDRPVYPMPGSVAVDKKTTTTQDEFYNNSNGDGVANIQLSATGKNSVMGVDLVIMIDQSSSMKYSLDSNKNAADTEADPSRLTVLKKSLDAMITEMQQKNLDVRIALADFGDLDHYEFTEAVVDKNKRNWPQFESYVQGPEGYSTEDDTLCYKVNYNYDPPNHLNFVLGHDQDFPIVTVDDKGETKTTKYNSQPFALHYTKYDNESGVNFTGKLLPHIYTGSGMVNADAFVDVSTLNSNEMTRIVNEINDRNEKALGTNYDVGLEYAYRLAYHRQQQNKTNRENRLVSVIFMSDGAAMQYNYFSGRSQVESWSQYLIGNTDDLTALGDSNPIGGMDITNMSKLNVYVKNLMEQMHQQLANGNLRKANGSAYSKCGHAVNSAKADDFASCFESKSGENLTLGKLVKILVDDAEEDTTDAVNVNSKISREAAQEFLRLIRQNNTSYTYSTYSPYWYFYNEKGLNWWAEAIKGDTSQVWPVINRHQGKTTAEWQGDLYQGVSITSSNNQNVPSNMLKDGNGKSYISGFQGLGVNIYTIAFAVGDDNNISADEAKTVLKNIATTPAMCYDAKDAAALTTAFNDIISKAVTSASNAYMTDTMGQQYDLLTSALTTSNSQLADYTPTITLKEYKVNADGTREFDKTWETITFGANGVASSNLKTGDIWGEDGGIRGEYIYYNTNSGSTVTLENLRGTGRNYTLQPETFFWSIGTIRETVMVLEYQVYLNGSTEGTLPNKQTDYDTNKEAVFHYMDQLGNMIDLPTVSPNFYWKETPPSVTYKFYLVNSAGEPVNDSMTKVGVASAKQIGSTRTQAITLGTGTYTDTTLTASSLLSTAGVNTGLYKLYSDNTSVTVRSYLNDQKHDVTITQGSKGTTTYVGTATSNKTNLLNRDLEGIVIYFAVQLIERAKPDTIVVDYGRPVTIDVLSNDTNLSGATLQGFTEPSGLGMTVSVNAVSFSNSSTASVDDSYAKITRVESNKKAKWELKTMQFTNYYQFGYTALADGYYYSSTVTVIPATSIYYEDNFVKYNEGPGTGTWASWNAPNDPDGKSQSADRPGDLVDAINKVYGYDDSYAYNSTYSGGEGHKVTVTADAPARAHFVFRGTGFDIIGVTNKTSGSITVNIYSGSTTDFDDPFTSVEIKDENGNVTGYDFSKIEGDQTKLVKTFVVNTYYSAGTRYQVPVIKCHDLPYGQYTVEVLVAYDDWFNEGQYKDEDGNKLQKFDFYLDAVRIYNSANMPTSGAIYDAYEADGELWPRYQELRNMILKANVVLEQQENGTYRPKQDSTDVSGMLFIDTGAPIDGKLSYSDYASWGPNNEVYLKKNQQVSFKLNVSGYESEAFESTTGKVKKVLIGLKSLSRTDDATVVIYKGSTEWKTLTVHTHDQYFDISALANQTVSIKVSGNTPVAVTNIRLTHTAKPDDYTVNLSAKSRASEAVEETLNTNPASLASLLTVSGEMAMELLDELNKDVTNPTDITPKYASLSFKDLIHTNIYFTASKAVGVDAANLGLAVFDDNAVDGTVDTASYVVNGAELVDGMYKVSTQGIPAKNLGDTIYFKVFAKEADGTYTYSKLLTYSPLEYATFLMESGSDMDKTLAAAMLNYGAEAQKYFGYKTDALMNAGVTAETQALLSGYSISDLDALDAMDETKVGVFAATEGFAEKYPSVSFKGAFRINYYFKPTAQVDGDVTFYYWTEETCNAVTELTADNADGTAVMTAENGVYTAVSGPIYAKNLDSTVYVAAVYEANGQTCCTGILPYSVAEYARSFAGTADDFAPFASAIGTYGSVAKAYFGN